MYKIIIFNNDLNQVKKICNIFLTNFSNLKLSGIVSDENELSYICKNFKIDMIIISQEDVINKNIENLLNNITYKIIISQQAKIPKSSKYILYLPSNFSEKYIINRFGKFITNINEKNIRKDVYHILESLNFDFKLVGTKYLAESIIYSYLNKNNYHFENLEKMIFPYVAKKFNVSEKNVKWSIIRSINNMNSNLKNVELRKQFFNFPDKITCKVLISEIVNRL